ncbi:MULTISPECIES: hypothetical protein [Streptomyces]|uniref:Integral membrane protein n=1 Tax=Streptomyces koelreuteriae TaxID=2838015 RepID=A0ABX8FJN1_9ACTN|nr:MULTISPECIES: hypothetical protein [Streptomyces]QWB21322.1 hypothetical protein KJK29_01365 [Streptomyces koelreuteriae]UUA04241.1 hypothetical protein NNW98_01365 [Streptomyces koelreuteriae]UUA11867.1 hypothetical protein NNW99_01365 [Streptomyces sp. CRCS-T-1]
MTIGSSAILVRRRRREPTAGPGAPLGVRGNRALAAVAVVFALAQLALVQPVLGLGWDEIVYVSQVTPHTPAAFFSAPRSRGVSLLVAPVASWSTSVPLLRVYLALLSGLALYLALRAWRGLFPTRVLVVGGALFASLWVTLFYGPQAMPNYWVAIGALICVGCFLRARREPSARAALWGVAAGAALMAWMRPTDAVYVTVPLLVLALVRRHRRLLLTLLAGLAAGAVPWVIEAYVGYGGLGERLAEASRIQGGLGWHIAVDDQLRSLGGRALCRPCTGPMPNPLVVIWWFVLPVLAGLGLLVAARARRLGRTLVPLACAATAALPYLFMIGYAAPRFLTPTYALLALPVADALWHLVKAPGGKWRPVAATLVALGLAGHLAAQLAVLNGAVSRNTENRRDWDRTATALHRLGVRPPCLLTGHEAIPIGYYTGCSSGATSGNNENTTPGAVLRTADRLPVAHIAPAGGTPPRYARAWPVHRISDLDVRVAPAPAAGQGAGRRG